MYARIPEHSEDTFAKVDSSYCKHQEYAPVAQLDRVLASEAKGQRFDSSRARHFSRFFQKVQTLPAKVTR